MPLLQWQNGSSSIGRGGGGVRRREGRHCVAMAVGEVDPWRRGGGRLWRHAEVVYAPHPPPTHSQTWLHAGHSIKGHRSAQAVREGDFLTGSVVVHGLHAYA